jgi:HAD superfamily hydrolase (TIGR01549 family)
MTDAPPLRAITLDLDDTLWPVLPTLVAAERELEAWLRAHAPRTAARTDAEVRAALRREVLARHPDRSHDMSFLRREGLRAALAAAGDDPALAGAAFEVFLNARQRVTPWPDVEPVLARWSRRYRLVAVSNGNADIRRVGLGAYFVGAVAAHEVGFAKPDPRMFAAACSLAGVAPAEALHVGDDPGLDVLAARAAGLRAAWLRRPQIVHRHPPDARVAPDDGPYEDLHALDEALHGRPAG